jgi:putative ABC transport system permease protein
VRRVALGTDVPGATDGAIAKIDIVVPYTVADRPAPTPGQEPNVVIVMASAGYFDVLGIPVLEGRAFEEGDRQETTPVVVVNETFARRTFGERSPLGERVIVRFGGDPVPREIVGVVGDVRPLGHASDPRAELYFPLSQVGSGSLTFVVEGEGDAALLATPVTEAIWKANPSQSVWGVATLDELLADWLRERTFNLLLLTAFAGVALLLAVVGVYGLVSFSVERRLGELGIRRALGGTASHIVGMVLREGAVLAATGTAIGLAGALWLTRFLRGMLYGVEPTDPLTFVGLGAGALVIATLAALLPALRATRVDPVVALRQE